MKLYTSVLILLPVTWASAQVQPQSTSGSAPSAYVSEEARESYLSAMRKRITINTRALDAFGLSQTPSGEIVRPPGQPKVPSLFAQAIRDLPVTAIMADRKEFLIGARTFREGEVFPISKSGKPVRVLIEKVNLDSILFEDVESHEKATRSLAIDPALKSQLEFRPEGIYSKPPPVVIP